MNIMSKIKEQEAKIRDSGSLLFVLCSLLSALDLRGSHAV
jgi:hypothetical protein